MALLLHLLSVLCVVGEYELLEISYSGGAFGFLDPIKATVYYNECSDHECSDHECSDHECSDQASPENRAFRENSLNFEYSSGTMCDEHFSDCLSCL